VERIRSAKLEVRRFPIDLERLPLKKIPVAAAWATPPHQRMAGMLLRRLSAFRK
jgi:hypothetical protein